jgi:hypothetical protein
MASEQILSLAAATACRLMCLYLFMHFALYTTMLCPTSAAKEHSLVRQITGSLGNSSVQSDAQALINFMRESDPSGVLKLSMSLQKPWVNTSDHCSWFGVICRQGRVWKLVVENLKLNGTFPPNTLSRLEGLQVRNALTMTQCAERLSNYFPYKHHQVEHSMLLNTKGIKMCKLQCLLDSF